MSMSWKITVQAYNQVLNKLARSYEFIIRNDGLDVRLRIKAISAISLVDWFDRRIPS